MVGIGEKKMLKDPSAKHFKVKKLQRARQQQARSEKEHCAVGKIIPQRHTARAYSRNSFFLSQV